MSNAQNSMFAQLVAVKSAKAPAKTAPKARTVRAATATKTPAKSVSAIKFAVEDFARPIAGALLYAHTQAFLDMSGLASGQAVPREFATKVLGTRAVAYHRGNGNLEATDKGLTITAKGYEFFAVRAAKTDPELYAAYMEFFAKGAQNEALNIKTKGSIVTL